MVFLHFARSCHTLPRDINGFLRDNTTFPWQAYRELYEMTLREQLESDLSGDLKTFMVYTQMETQEFDALLMKKAM